MKIGKCKPLFIISLFVLLVFGRSLNVFFAQDDFILITHFSSNTLFRDFIDSFSFNNGFQWRPILYLFFVFGSRLFNQNFQLYHLLIFTLHIASAFFIYKIAFKVFKNKYCAVVASVFYAINPLHFVGLSWISGSATIIGFFFLILSFYLFLQKMRLASFFLFILSVLSSEAMIVGFLFYPLWEFFINKKAVNKKWFIVMGLFSLVFIYLQLFALRSNSSVSDYKIELSAQTFSVFRYYLLRTLGVADIVSFKLWPLLLYVWLSLVALIGVLSSRFEKDIKLIAFFSVVFLLGLFPFVLMPYHLSPHYMSVSLFGLSMIVGALLEKIGKTSAVLLLLILLVVNFFAVVPSYKYSWVVKRSALAKSYLYNVTILNKAAGETIIFDDNITSTSQEAYYSLGTGTALKFWFGHKNYKTCFTAFDNCYK